MIPTTLAEALVTFATTMASDYQASQALEGLMKAVVEGLGVDGAGIMLNDEHGDQRFVAASDERVRAIEQMQIAADEGPCVLAAETGTVIVTDDLRDGDARFPDFARQAVAIGMLGVHSFPMVVEETVLGAMNLYRDRPGRLSEADLVNGKVFADMASLYLLGSRRMDAAADQIDRMKQALDRNAPIEQAKGYVAAVRHIPPTDAYEMIRRYARANRRRVLDVSVELVSGTRQIADLDLD